MEREIFQRDPAAAILPYDPVRDAIVMVEQFRPGALLSGENPWQVEPIAGICDVGETPEATVRREAIEEAGCTLGHIVPACAYLVSPGCIDEKVYVFCGSVDSSTIGTVGGMETENEETIVHVLDLRDLSRRPAQTTLLLCNKNSGSAMAHILPQRAPTDLVLRL